MEDNIQARGAGPGVILIVDFGGQYTRLIARRLRELGAPHIIVSGRLGLSHILRETMHYKVRGVILGDGPEGAWSKSEEEVARWSVSLGVPVLGVGYGHQLLNVVMGGRISSAPRSEFGPVNVKIIEEDDILRGHSDKFTAWMDHSSAVVEPPPGARVLATSDGSPVAAVKIGEHVYGVQWHPEAAQTEHGMTLLGNWLDLTGLRGTWERRGLIEDLINYIRSVVGDSVAVAAVSGGVDSTVAAVLARRALGERLIPVFIDHGLHPEGEVERALGLLRKVGLEPVVVDASNEFLEALRGVTDPEEKRRVVGRVYAQVLMREARARGAEYLVQGTIYPDVAESGAGGTSGFVKTHHNVGGLPGDFPLKLVEPLRWFYKDEVRDIARALGLPDELGAKQPIPGPGLAVRVEGEVTREKLRVLRRADAIVRSVIESRGLSRSLWQYFAILTNSKATGVRGGRRAYGYVVAIRVVESKDATTAKPARLPWEVLEEIASRITAEVPEVVRVVYDVTSKPPATIEWE